MDKICLIILCALILSVKCQESIDNDNEIDNHTPIQEVPNDVEQFEVLSPNNGTIGYEYQHHSHLDDGDDNEDQSGLFSEPIVGETILRLSESPYTITNDIQIRRGAKLIIEPGVTLQFAPMIGITVRGAIEAIVSQKNVQILILSVPVRLTSYHLLTQRANNDSNLSCMWNQTYLINLIVYYQVSR